MVYICKCFLVHFFAPEFYIALIAKFASFRLQIIFNTKTMDAAKLTFKCRHILIFELRNH